MICTTIMDCISSFTNNHLRILCIISAILPSFLTVLSQNCSCSDPQQLPSPAPSPQPSLTFVDLRLAVVYPVIQRFKLTITSDPLGITSQWVGPDICSYQGFYCDHPPDNLSAIALAAVDFNEFHLGAPTLVGFIDQLPDLAFFHANSNNFSGIIPPKITQLPYLYELDISNNNFSGRFPTEVFEIKELSFLDIRFNSFSGSVPLQIFNQALDVLYINNNNFMQTLPNNLGSSPVLYLTLANNKFTGPIPRSIGNTSSRLTEVLFLNNYLTGCIPYEIGFLKKAVVFDAGNNLLTGPIPSSLGCLESIEQLNFAGNQLYGQVPEVLCAVGSLLNLSLSDNYFTMIGPMCQNLVKSGVLDVRKNCIHGVPEQRPWKECYYFFFHLKHDCPNHNWLYNYVPCKVHQPLPPPSPSCQQSRKPPWGSGSVTYPTLFRHRL